MSQAMSMEWLAQCGMITLPCQAGSMCRTEFYIRTSGGKNQVTHSFTSWVSMLYTKCSYCISAVAVQKEHQPNDPVLVHMPCKASSRG